MIAATANGRPRKKFQRQPALSVMTPPSSGPPTMPMPITAPMRPMYRPRSRGLMMSAIRTVPSAVRPPAPMPCRARMPMSIPVPWDSPARAEETTEMASASWMSSLRSTRSASLPQIGVEIVVVSRVAVTTQVKADCVPSRSEMIRGSDEDTTLVARIETNIPSRMPESASRTSRWVIFGAVVISAVLVGAGAVVLDMVSLSWCWGVAAVAGQAVRG